MRTLRKAIATVLAGALQVIAGTGNASAADQAPIVIDFANETVGAEPTSFAAAVGSWRIATDGDRKVLMVDGSKWKEGQPSAGLADKARTLYGERYAEFLDNVTNYAFYPIAVARQIDDFQDGEISVRFKGLAGRIDQGAGIMFNLQPNGNYYTLRANALENNLVLWKYERGRRSSVKWVRNTPTATLQWHDLKVEVHGAQIKGYLDGKLYLEHTLPAPVSGRIGVWSKADSVVYFTDYRVIRAAP